YVARITQGTTYGDDAFVLTIVIARRIVAETDRRIQNRIVRTQSVVDRRSVNKWLERRTGLSHRLRGAIKFAVIEVIPTDHCFDFTTFGLNREQGALNFRLLFKRDFDFFVRRIHGTNLEERDITGF